MKIFKEETTEVQIQLNDGACYFNAISDIIREAERLDNAQKNDLLSRIEIIQTWFSGSIEFQQKARQIREDQSRRAWKDLAPDGKEYTKTFVSNRTEATSWMYELAARGVDYVENRFHDIASKLSHRDQIYVTWYLERLKLTALVSTAIFTGRAVKVGNLQETEQEYLSVDLQGDEKQTEQGNRLTILRRGIRCRFLILSDFTIVAEDPEAFVAQLDTILDDEIYDLATSYGEGGVKFFKDLAPTYISANA